eukprot:3260292-Rhodomonas_salina.5
MQETASVIADLSLRSRPLQAETLPTRPGSSHALGQYRTFRSKRVGDRESCTTCVPWPEASSPTSAVSKVRYEKILRCRPGSTNRPLGLDSAYSYYARSR